MNQEKEDLNRMNQEELVEALFDGMGYRWPAVFPSDRKWNNDFSKNIAIGSTYMRKFGIEEWMNLENKLEAIYQSRLAERIANE